MTPHGVAMGLPPFLDVVVVLRFCCVCLPDLRACGSAVCVLKLLVYIIIHHSCDVFFSVICPFRFVVLGGVLPCLLLGDVRRYSRRVCEGLWRCCWYYYLREGCCFQVSLVRRRR